MFIRGHCRPCSDTAKVLTDLRCGCCSKVLVASATTQCLDDLASLKELITPTHAATFLVLTMADKVKEEDMPDQLFRRLLTGCGPDSSPTSGMAIHRSTDDL